MPILHHLFEQNRAWSEKIRVLDPEFFDKLAHQQAPSYMWIGCADSRVPANQITGMLPGELFVHRNVANVVVHTDLNCLSVVQFAVDLLRVRHIIVCGHYGCSGVHAALTRRKVGLADNWLRHVQDVSDKHGAYLGKVAGDACRHDARATVMTADDDVAHVQEVDGELDHRQAVEVGMHDHVGYVAVDEDLAGRKTYDLVGRHARIGAAYPKVFGALLVREAPEETGIVARDALDPGAIVVEQLLRGIHMGSSR